MKKLDQRLKRQKRKIAILPSPSACSRTAVYLAYFSSTKHNKQDTAYGPGGDQQFQDPLQKESHSSTDESNGREEGVFNFCTRRHEINATGLGDGAAKNNLQLLQTR